MLRNILMLLGFLVVLLPYIGLPYEYDKWLDTFAGFAIIVIVYFSKRSRVRREVTQEFEETPRALHVERTEVEDRPRMHLERKTVVDTERRHEAPNTDTLIEKKVTVVRRRRQKAADATENQTENT